MKIASSSIFLYYCNLFCDKKFPSKRKCTSHTPERKPWQRNQKPSIWRCISKLKTWWFSIVMLAFFGGKLLISCNLVSLPGIFTPSIHATVQIPSSRDLRLEHWIHACAIRDISPGIVMGHTSFQNTPKGHSIQRNKKLATTSCKKSDFFFSELYF